MLVLAATTPKVQFLPLWKGTPGVGSLGVLHPCALSGAVRALSVAPHLQDVLPGTAEWGHDYY